MLRDKPLVRIAVHIGAVEYGVRYWPAVPRIGEKMMVSVRGEVVQLVVSDVVWGISKESRLPATIDGTCEVAVVCEPANV